MKGWLVLWLPLFVALSCEKEPQTPEHYFFLNSSCDKFNYEQIAETFGPQSGQEQLAVGNAILMYILQRPVQDFVTLLNKHFEHAERYDIPVLVQLDPITFWNTPELWNWWDPEMEGYKDSNRENVEWYGWGSENAVKIGWLNWGRQIRLRPMANVFSPAYQAEVKKRMDIILSFVADWYKSLPKDKKYLLCGIKLTGELGFGFNNWYYPGGNDLFDKPEADDPQYGIKLDSIPSRGVQQTGYAAMTYSGIRTEGEITEEDWYKLEWEYSKFIADLAQGYGFPRSMLFSHTGGVKGDLRSTIQANTCPSWSLYWKDAVYPQESEAMDYLKESDAPYWAISEWNISEQPKDVWTKALTNCFSIAGCRYVSLYNYDSIFKNNGEICEDAIEAIKEYQQL